VTLFDIAYDDFKREDTTNVIAITLYTDDKQPITPNASHTWKAKVSKEDKYVGEYPVTISGNTIKLSSSNLTRLPNGDYGLELWESYNGSTTIYPSAGVMEFRVHRNANDTLGTVDPTIDINGIIDDLHKAGQNVKVVATNTLPAGSKASVTQSITNGENQLTFNIPQGIQGEKGNVGPAPTLKIGTVTKLNPDQAPTADLTGDNGTYTLDLGIPQGVQGETNATATNTLNVANSVDAKISNLPTSTNIYSNLPNSWVVGTLGENNPAGVDWKQTFISWNAFNRIMPGNNAYDVTPATGTITISWADGWKVFLLEYDANKNYIGKQANSIWHTTSPYTVKLTNSARYIAIALAKTDDSNISPNDLIDSNGNPVVKLKVEQGSMATPFSWCAQDIQSEIDTLKAAVKKWEGVTDAILGAIGINHNLITATSKITWNATLGKLSSPEIGTDRFTFIDSTIRGLWASKVAPIANGKKYILRCKIRANESMQLTQFGNTDAIFDQTMITTDWQTVETIFDSAKGVNVYADGKSGDWFEISDQVLIEAGGVAQTNLLADWATNDALSNWTTNDTTVQTKITNAVLSFDVKSSSVEYVDFYKKDVNLTPGHTYKLSYMARGTGIVRSHLYAWTNKGSTSETDSLNFTTLTDDWRQYSQTIVYDPTSDNSSNTKHFLFRWKKSDCESLTGQISDLTLIDVTE
jgi:hypothetical protein